MTRLSQPCEGLDNVATRLQWDLKILQGRDKVVARLSQPCEGLDNVAARLQRDCEYTTRL